MEQHLSSNGKPALYFYGRFFFSGIEIIFFIVHVYLVFVFKILDAFWELTFFGIGNPVVMDEIMLTNV